MTVDCINLKKCFGKLFRISFVGDFDSDPDGNPNPWRQEIRGRVGIIQPFDRTRLVVTTSPAIAKRLAYFPDTVSLGGPDEDGKVSVVIRSDQIETAASLIGIRRVPRDRPLSRRAIDCTGIHGGKRSSFPQPIRIT